jgi:nucleotide-binding universal stress UspA family protein
MRQLIFMAGFKHILVGTDLSDRSERACERAIWLGRERAATVELLHVVEEGLVVQLRERERALAEEYLRDWLVGLSPADRPGAKVAIGHPLAGILDEAHEQNADLIVLGEPGKTGLKELFIGTTAESVARHSDRPVLIVKRRPSDAYRRVFVAIDFSEATSRALKAAYEIAPTAEFLAVHAWQVPAVGLATRQAAENNVHDENELLRQRVARQASDHLVALEASQPRPPCIKMIEGNPFFVIRTAIGSFHPDLLAIGTHARSGIAVAMLGSLAREFLIDAPCDVLVARA